MPNRGAECGYNKPDFKYRDEIFTILIVNAWELLLKAKIVGDACDDLASVYVPGQSSTYKLNRNGNPITIEITRAMQVLSLPLVVKDNLGALVDIRDTAVHLYHTDPLSYLVYTLGLAALRNYQKAMRDWFGRSLLEYNFYILPLGFAYNFQQLSLIDLDKGPESVARLIAAVMGSKASADSSSGYYLVCEIGIEMKAAKHFPAGADITAAVASNPEGAIIVQRTVPLTHRYPLTYRDLCAKVKRLRPGVKQSEIDRVIKDHSIKKDQRMAAINFRNKGQEDDYRETGLLPQGIPIIYNEDAVRFIAEHTVDLAPVGTLAS